MFTGLVEQVGVLRRRSGSPVARATIEADFKDLVLGESIDVHGACLTVDKIHDGAFEVDMSSETLARTTLGAMALGAKVHLERATPLGGRMGGHVVLGHVDGVGEITAREPSGDAIRVEVRAPAALARFLAEKGSVALNGISLTLNEVARPTTAGCAFAVMIIPHTLGRTTLVDERVGAKVNIEVDVLARYVARQLDLGKTTGELEESGESSDRRMLDKLRAGGFA